MQDERVTKSDQGYLSIIGVEGKKMPQGSLQSLGYSI